jgi:hypothetical protein
MVMIIFNLIVFFNVKVFWFFDPLLYFFWNLVIDLFSKLKKLLKINETDKVCVEFVGTLEHWNIGTLKHCNTGILEHWNIAKLEHCNIGILEH